MTTQMQLMTIIRELNMHRKTYVSVHGWEILVESVPDHGLRISTPIYKGENYIPPGVRAAILSPVLETHSHLRTHLSLEEDLFTVHLHYQGGPEDLLQASLAPILEEFSWVAEQWWQHLDDRDKKDLVYVPVK